MPFNFGGPEFPTALKFARSLLISEAILFLFAALISLLLDFANVGGSLTASSSTSVSPALLVVSLVAAALLIYLAVDLRNLRPMTRNVIVATQILLFVSTVITSLTQPISVALVTVLVVGVLYCLLVDKGARAAFATGTSAAAGGASASAATSKARDDKVQDILDKARARDDAQKATETDANENGEGAEKAEA